MADLLRADLKKHASTISKSPFGGDVTDAASQRVERTWDRLGTERGLVVNEHAALRVLFDLGLAESP